MEQSKRHTVHIYIRAHDDIDVWAGKQYTFIRAVVIIFMHAYMIHTHDLRLTEKPTECHPVRSQTTRCVTQPGGPLFICTGKI